MPGTVTLLTRERALGWAAHPRLPTYPVTLNLVLRSRVMLTTMVDGPPPGGARSVPGPGWFDIDLAALGLPDLMPERLAFIIGETDERLSTPLPPATGPVLRVEDILSLNLSRRWVTGATYHDALRAGRSDADVLDLLYRDILGRSADPGGLANYLDRLRAGISTLDDVRASLIASDECRTRPRDVSEASGAIFSLRLVAHAGKGPGDHVVNLLPEATPFRSRVTAALLEAPAAAPAGPDPVPRLAGDVLTLPARMAEFATGWNGMEGSGEGERRWMERHATLLNPWPHLPVTGIVLRLHETYLHQRPELTCLLDDVEASWRHEGETGAPSRVWIGPPAGMAACRFVTLRLDCAIAGSPREQGISDDPRLLSISVADVSFTYGDAADGSAAVLSEAAVLPEAEVSAADPPPAPEAAQPEAVAAHDAPPAHPADPVPHDAPAPDAPHQDAPPAEASAVEAPPVDCPPDHAQSSEPVPEDELQPAHPLDHAQLAEPAPENEPQPDHPPDHAQSAEPVPGDEPQPTPEASSEADPPLEEPPHAEAPSDARAAVAEHPAEPQPDAASQPAA